MPIEHPIEDKTAATTRPAYLTEKELAIRLNMSVKWLQKMRCRGEGIPFCKFGSRVLYSFTAILAFESQALRISTSDTGPM